MALSCSARVILCRHLSPGWTGRLRPARAPVHIADSVTSERIGGRDGVCLSSNLRGGMVEPRVAAWLSHDVHERDEVETCIV